MRLFLSLPRRRLTQAASSPMSQRPIGPSDVLDVPVATGSGSSAGVYAASVLTVLATFIFSYQDEDDRLKDTAKWLTVSRDLFRAGRPEFVHALLRDVELPSDPLAASLICIARAESATSFLMRLQAAGDAGIEIVTPNGESLTVSGSDELFTELSGIALSSAKAAVAYAESASRVAAPYAELDEERRSWRGDAPHPRVTAAVALIRATAAAGDVAAARKLADAAVLAEPHAAVLHGALAQLCAYTSRATAAAAAPSKGKGKTPAVSDDVAAARKHYVLAAYHSPLAARGWLTELAQLEATTFAAPRRAARLEAIAEALPGHPSTGGTATWAADVEALRHLNDVEYVTRHTAVFERISKDPYRCLEALQAAHGRTSEIVGDSARAVKEAGVGLSEVVRETLVSQYPSFVGTDKPWE